MTPSPSPWDNRLHQCLKTLRCMGVTGLSNLTCPPVEHSLLLNSEAVSQINTEHAA